VSERLQGGLNPLRGPSAALAALGLIVSRAEVASKRTTTLRVLRRAHAAPRQTRDPDSDARPVLAAQIFTSWTPLIGWLRRVEGLNEVA
jgi:hypothetical protein